LYQRLLNGAVAYRQVGDQIVKEIKAAQDFRQIDAVRELASILINYPLREYRLIAKYYLVWCQVREKKYPAKALENIFEQSRTFKAQALVSRAALEHYQGNFKDALYFYSESFKVKPTASEYVLAAKAIAAIKSIEGFHESALKDLERLKPLIKYVEPFSYFDYLNSLAVELGEAGRKDEARHIIRRVLASPYAWAYPEWQQTAEDLRPARSSFISPTPPPLRIGNLLRMPATERTEPVKQDRPAPIVSLQQWKMKMAKKEEYNKPAKDKPKTTSERVVYILSQITTELSDEELDEIIREIDEVQVKKDKQ
jgi:tetratricopeptide (TPR) repeat protein